MLRFDPFTEMDALTRGLLSRDVAGTARSPRLMPMDLYKVDDHYVLTADLPGVDPGSVEVSVDNGTLTLSAERTARSEDSVQWLVSERFSGTFRRQLTLGDNIDSAGITADYENGVLSVTIPVAERAKPRRIQVGRSDERHSIEADATSGTA